MAPVMDIPVCQCGCPAHPRFLRYPSIAGSVSFTSRSTYRRLAPASYCQKHEKMASPQNIYRADYSLPPAESFERDGLRLHSLLTFTSTSNNLRSSQDITRTTTLHRTSQRKSAIDRRSLLSTPSTWLRRRPSQRVAPIVQSLRNSNIAHLRGSSKGDR